MKIRFFTIIQGLSALSIAGIAAYFSVYGISKLYSGATRDVIMMASSLEVGKLIVASWLYRNYKKKGFGLKVYFSIGLIGLMFITSIGIYGFLTAAYQGSTIELQIQQTKIDLLKERYDQLITEKDRLINEKKSFENSRDNELKGMILTDSTRYYDSIQRKKILNRYNSLIEEKQRKINSINGDILEIQPELSDLKIKMLHTGVDVGPLVYISKVLKVSMDTVANWFTLFLIFLFDPLAITLVIAFNKSWQEDTGRIFEESVNLPVISPVKKDEINNDPELRYENELKDNMEPEKDVIKKNDAHEIKKETDVYVESLEKPTSTEEKIKEKVEAIFDETERNYKDRVIRTTITPDRGVQH